MLAKVVEWTQKLRTCWSDGIAVLYAAQQSFAVNAPFIFSLLICPVRTTCFYVSYFNTEMNCVILKLNNGSLTFLKTGLFNICRGADSRSR